MVKCTKCTYEYASALCLRDKTVNQYTGKRDENSQGRESNTDGNCSHFKKKRFWEYLSFY